MSTQDTPQVAPPATMVIFGAGGDLTKRKLIPALYHLASQGLLSERFSMLGVDRVAQDSEGYRETLDHGIREFLGEEFEQGLWDSVLPRAYYMPGDFQDPQTYVRLKELLGQVKAEQGNSADVLFYLATPPRFFGEIAKRLGEAGLAQESDTAWRRIIIEKPFGHDLASARALNHELHQHFQEHQVYRIDHYLGKETVQNIMAYRFGNATVEPIWNRNYIDHVQITVAESLGVENRASYYEQAGALRDMVPNHMLSVLSIVAMEPSNSFDADAIRDEQAKVLRAIQPLTPEQVLSCAVRGQYGAGVMPGGEQVPAYRDEPGIARDSNTVTFAALKLQIDTWRWAGVPFYLRTGKRMPKRYTEVVVQYRHAPNMLFRESLVKRFNLPANMLLLSIQPKEGISLCFNAKVPGPEPRLGTVEMDFRYEDYFGNAPSTGYETLIHDCLTGDATLFKRADSIELGWEVVDPVLDVWDALAPRDFPNYPAGSPGPPAAEELLARDGRRWRTCPS